MKKRHDNPLQDFDKSPLDGELWDDAFGFDGLYQISNFGRVYSCRRDIIMKSYYPPHQPCVKFSINGVRHFIDLSRMVAQTFFGEIPDKMVVKHLDKNPQNCRLSNLEIVPEQNIYVPNLKRGIYHIKQKKICQKTKTKRDDYFEQYVTKNDDGVITDIICKVCLKRKPASSFYIRKVSGQHRRECSECCSAQSSQRYIKKTKK